MNIKFKSFSMLLAMAAALSMTACKEENLAGGQINPEEDGQSLFISAAISLPTSVGTRSTTDDYPENGTGETNSNEENDSEYGYDYENDVRSMILLFATPDHKYVTHSVVKGIETVPAGSKFNFQVDGEIKYSALEAAYDETTGVFSQGTEVKVYAFCNYTAQLLNELATTKLGDTTWVDFSGTVYEAASPAGHTPAITNTIWASRSFLMSNAAEFTTEFPKTVKDWTEYADRSTPFDVTNGDAIKVERTAARIDFRDGSEDPKNAPNTYNLYVKPSDDDNLNLFSVKLTRMALVNMSNEYYYLRRVSDDGTQTGKNWELSGREYQKGLFGQENFFANYVVDVNAGVKKQSAPGIAGITPATASTYFNFPLYAEEKNEETGYFDYNIAAWYVDNISEVTKGTVDTWAGSVDNRYHIWRYVTENTIPAGPENQQTVLSTGVIFKGSIIAGEDIAESYIENVEGEVEGERYVSELVEEALTAAKLHLEYKKTVNNAEVDFETATEYNYPVLYSYDNMLWAGIDDLVRGAIREGANSPLYFDVQNTLNNWYLVYTPLTAKDIEEGKMIEGEFKYSATDPTAGEGQKVQKLNIEIYNDIEIAGTNESGFGACKIVELVDATFKKHAAKDNHITVYEVSNENDGEGWGYYCYYFYWNRHNDNEKSGEMGPMEFATVRNNVYKLAVTKIGQLGHPRLPGNDPDPVDPNDPDEEPLRYFRVEVEVLPWVVRENNIEF